MNKPVYLLPFIFVYRMVTFLVKLPILFVKYFSLGFFFTCYFFIERVGISIYWIIKYFIYGVAYCGKLLGQALQFFMRLLLEGIVLCSYFIYKFFKYLGFGVVFPFFLLFGPKHGPHLSRQEKRAQKAKKEIEEKQARAAREAEKKKKLQQEALDKIKKQEIKTKALLDEQNEKAARKKKMNDAYINENAKREKHNLAYYLNKFFMGIGKFPKTLSGGFKNWYANLSFVKNAKNTRDINRQALLISFEGEDAKKSDVKITFEYEAKNPEGKYVKDHFDAFSKVEVHSYLLSEGYEVYSIKTSKLIQFLYGNVGKNKTKIKNKHLIFFLTQLSTYIKAGIPLADALKVLIKQYKQKSYKRIFSGMIYDLTMGDNFSDALSKQGNAFPRLLINMVKASEMTGELPEALDDMADYFTEIDKTRKQMITAMMYPSIIFVIAIAVVTFIMVYVVPQFVKIYENIDATQIPGYTLFVLNLSHFLQNNYIWLLLGIFGFIAIFWYLYKNVKVFKTVVQWVLMHMPVMGNILIYNEVTMFTKTFASLLSHNVFITDSMEILNKITENEIYKMLILDTITNLARGEKISLAFKDHWAFPLPAYEMIVTGEKTGQLPEMMGKVSTYYQELHRNAVSRIKAFVEPALIIFLTVMVGGIVLAIVIPMFNMYTALQ